MNEGTPNIRGHHSPERAERTERVIMKPQGMERMPDSNHPLFALGLMAVVYFELHLFTGKSQFCWGRRKKDNKDSLSYVALFFRISKRYCPATRIWPWAGMLPVVVRMYPASVW